MTNEILKSEMAQGFLIPSREVRWSHGSEEVW